MTINAGTHKLGPGNAGLKVKTAREGVAAKVGHDLVIEVTRWDATLNVADDPSQSSVQFSADAGSLEVREGTGGAKPLSDKDRGDIRRNIADKVLRGSEISFRSSDVKVDNGRMTINGDLNLNGQVRSVSFQLQVDDGGRVSASVPLVQSTWGIKPFSAMMGALKVRDQVQVELSGQLG